MNNISTSELSLSIVSHNHAQLMRRLLIQLNDQPSLFGMRVVVTLNVFVEEFDPTHFESLNITIIRNKNPKGFGANHNAAFELCDTKWFGILNPDLLLVGNEPFTVMLERCLTERCLRNIGLIAPRVVAQNMCIEDSVRSNLTPWSVIQRAIKRGNNERSYLTIQNRSAFFWVAGMCMLVRAESFRSVGGFDERYFLYCEDYDLCARLYNAGWSIRLDDKSVVMHEAQRDSRRNITHLLMHLNSLIKVWLSLSFWRVTFTNYKKLLNTFFKK